MSSDAGYALFSLTVLALIFLGFWKAIEILLKLFRFFRSLLKRERGISEESLREKLKKVGKRRK